MRSLLLRIVLASTGTILAALIVFTAMLIVVLGPVNERLIHHFQARQIEDALDALHRGGPAEAAAYLARLNRSLGATHYLTDGAGVDVVTGEDRSALLHAPRPFFGPPRAGDDIVVIEPSADGQNRLIILAPPPISRTAFLPYLALIVGVIGVFCWFLARDIVTPVRTLAGAVERCQEATRRFPGSLRTLYGTRQCPWRSHPAPIPKWCNGCWGMRPRR